MPDLPGTRPQIPAQQDRGLTLVELLMTMMLLVLVISVTGTILLNALRVQANEQGVANGTGSAQSLTRSIARGIGNSSSFTVDPVSAAGQLLHSRVVSTALGGTTTATCQAWYYSKTYSALFSQTKSSAITTAPTVTSSTVAPTGWAILATGVALPSSASAPFVSVSSTLLSVNLTVAAGSAARPVVIDTSIGTATQSDTASSPTSC